MAKFGSNDDGKYDPFSAISTSLASLSEPPETQKQDQPTKNDQKDLSADQPASTEILSTPPSITPIESSGGGEKPKVVPSASALQITKRFKTTRQEASDFEMASVRLAAKLGINVDFSKLTRALWETYLRHEEDILRNVPEGDIWERPANNDPVGLAALDQKLSTLINDGFMVASRRPKNNQQ